LENQRRLYLFNGETYITVPESTWQNELKNSPFGATVRKSVEEPFVFKGWVKIRESRDSNSNASETEWLFQETGNHMVVSVDRDGQLKVDGTPIGMTTSGETFKMLEKAVEEKGKWFTKATADGTAKQRIFIPPEKLRKPDGLVAGNGARQAQDITKMEKSNAYNAMDQLIGKYDLPTLETVATKEDVVRNCNAMLELLAKEQDAEKKKALMLAIDKQLTLAETMAKSMGLQEHVKELITSKDEPKASKEYAQMSAQATDPKTKSTLAGMSKDEARHDKNLHEIARRLG
jgi:hypothetical protein